MWTCLSISMSPPLSIVYTIPTTHLPRWHSHPLAPYPHLSSTPPHTHCHQQCKLALFLCRTDEFRLKWVDDTHALSIFNSSLLGESPAFPQECTHTFTHTHAHTFTHTCTMHTYIHTHSSTHTHTFTCHSRPRVCVWYVAGDFFTLNTAHQACRITFPHFNARMLALGSDQSKAVGRNVAGNIDWCGFCSFCQKPCFHAIRGDEAFAHYRGITTSAKNDSNGSSQICVQCSGHTGMCEQRTEGEGREGSDGG